jgi:hypothetical protein
MDATGNAYLPADSSTDGRENDGAAILTTIVLMVISQFGESGGRA